MTTATRQPAPAPAPTEPCMWGCTPSTGWRWYRTLGWRRVCRAHCGSRAVAYHGDYVADPPA
jgi:hypothetical protein